MSSAGTNMDVDAPGLASETWDAAPADTPVLVIDRHIMEVDIACAGFGPAMGGFLTTLTREWSAYPDDPAFESKVAPGMPLQVLCYERANDIASGVSGIVTRAQGIRASFPDLNPAEIPMAVDVKSERVLSLLDPIGASRRSLTLRGADSLLHIVGPMLGLNRISSITPECLSAMRCLRDLR